MSDPRDTLQSKVLITLAQLAELEQIAHDKAIDKIASANDELIYHSLRTQLVAATEREESHQRLAIAFVEFMAEVRLERVETLEKFEHVERALQRMALTADADRAAQRTTAAIVDALFGEIQATNDRMTEAARAQAIAERDALHDENR